MAAIDPGIQQRWIEILTGRRIIQSYEAAVCLRNVGNSLRHELIRFSQSFPVDDFIEDIRVIPNVLRQPHHTPKRGQVSALVAAVYFAFPHLQELRLCDGEACHELSVTLLSRDDVREGQEILQAAQKKHLTLLEREHVTRLLWVVVLIATLVELSPYCLHADAQQRYESMWAAYRANQVLQLSITVKPGQMSSSPELEVVDLHAAPAIPAKLFSLPDVTVADFWLYGMSLEKRSREFFMLNLRGLVDLFSSTEQIQSNDDFASVQSSPS